MKKITFNITHAISCQLRLARCFKYLKNEQVRWPICQILFVEKQKQGDQEFRAFLSLPQLHRQFQVTLSYKRSCLKNSHEAKRIERAAQLRAHAVPPEDPNSISTPTCQRLTASVISAPGGQMSFSGFHSYLCSHALNPT